jgi:hypothetical protein
MSDAQHTGSRPGVQALDANMSRCPGYAHEPKCQACARRRQLALDDPGRFYPIIVAAIFNGRCIYHIPVNGDADQT